MTGPDDLDISHLSFGDQLKAQALVLAPLLQVMRDDLGKERADALMEKGLEPFARQAGAAVRAMSDGPTLVGIRALVDQISASGDCTYEFHESHEEVLSFDVTDCVLAQFYQALGIADIGFHVACSLDYQMLPHLGDDVELERTQTLMQGATHCDFRLRKV